MTGQRAGGRVFTGRHMLAIMLAFFGVVIAVNLTMAVMATRSWTGLVVENTYVGSREFNQQAAEGRAQAALGWKSTLDIGPAGITYRLADASGAPVVLKSVVAAFRHPTSEADDRTLALERMPDGSFATAEIVRDGVWIAEIHADTGGAKPYRDVSRITVSGGSRK